MTDSVVGHLIWKDWRLYRGLMVLVTMARRAIALAIVQLGSETGHGGGQRLVLHRH